MNDIDSTGTPCHACGSPTLPDAAFCHRCGAPVLDLASLTTDQGQPSAAEVQGGSEVPEPEPVPAPSDAAFTASPGATQQTGTGYQAGQPAADAAPPPPPDDQMARAMRGDYEVQIGAWMGRGWSVFTRDGGLFIGYAAILWVIHAVAAPILLIVGPMLMAGMLTAALISRRGDRLRFSDFWLGFNDFLPLFLAFLVSSAFLILGLCTCGIVTIYLWVGYQFVNMLILDRGLDFWDALEASRKAIHRQWFGMAAFAALLLAINVFAYLTTITLGLVVTLPLTSCALVEAYADIFGVRGRIRGESQAAR